MRRLALAQSALAKWLIFGSSLTLSMWWDYGHICVWRCYIQTLHVIRWLCDEVFPREEVQSMLSCRCLRALCSFQSLFYIRCSKRSHASHSHLFGFFDDEYSSTNGMVLFFCCRSISELRFFFLFSSLTDTHLLLSLLSQKKKYFHAV